MSLKNHAPIAKVALATAAVIAVTSLVRLGLSALTVQRSQTHLADLERQSAIRTGNRVALLEQYRSVGKIRRAAEKQFSDLQLKYGGVTDRGDSIVSVRSVPSIQIEEETSPVLFRVQVPEHRPIWLRYGVIPCEQESLRNPHDFRTAAELPTGTAFEHEGLYQYQLPPGLHLISIQCEVASSIPIRVLLNDQPILSTSYRCESYCYLGYDQAYFYEQEDRKVGEQLPWLFSCEMYPQEGDLKSKESAPNACSLWLSDVSIDAASFPL